MTRFTVHTIDSAPAGSRDRLAAVKAAWGFVPNLQAVLAESPVALEAYDHLFGLAGKSTLTPVEQQVVFLAAATFLACEYCVPGHTYLARSVKMDEAAIAALRNGTAIPDARLEALRGFTEAVSRERGFVGDAAVEAFLAAGFTRENVLEVVTIIATKTISGYVNHIAHTPKEAFMSDPAFGWTAPVRETAA